MGVLTPTKSCPTNTMADQELTRADWQSLPKGLVSEEGFVCNCLADRVRKVGYSKLRPRAEVEGGRSF